MAVNLYKVNVYKIRWNFRWVKLPGVRFEKSKLLTFSSHILNFVKQLLQIHNNYNINFSCSIPKRNCIYNCNISLSYYPRIRRYYRHCIFIPLHHIRRYQEFPSPRYHKESIPKLAISKIFEKRIYNKFEVYRMINSNLINSKFKASQFLIKHNKSDLIISLAKIFLLFK